MKYEIDDEFGGVPEGFKYELEDTPSTEKEWRSLLANFSQSFPEFSRDDEDYGFGEWHHGMRVLAVYLYNESFYNEGFILKVQGILQNQPSETFSQFECYSASKRLIAHFMVFKDKVIFDRLSAQTGLVRQSVSSKSL